MVGKSIAHFEITAKIGEGGMGEVYRATDTKLNREVALKVLPKEWAANPERRMRFEREARAVAALNHPNIVTVHSVEEVAGILFITMELVEGRTLTNMLPQNGFSLNEFWEIAMPLANAVSSAHRKGITHRDLKPDNIMVDGEGRLRVLDFGLAKLHDATGCSPRETQAPTAALETAEGKILGTVAYMSPEQAEGKAVDPRSDVFSLGTILFEMATGKRPFGGETTMSTIGAILKDEPAPITDYNRSLPRHLGRIIRRCLAKDPERRFQTALGLRNELEQLKAEINSGELVSKPGHVAPPPKHSWRHLPVLAMVVAVAIVGAFTVRPLLWPDAPEPSYTSRPITATIGLKADLNWSPNSEFIAYSSMVSGSLDLMVKPVAGGDAVVRASGIGDEVAGRWSPDGKYLAYISTSEPGTFVFLVPPHGGSARKLIETNFPALHSDLHLQSMGDRPWSQDSRSLLVSRVSPSGQVAIYRVDRENGGAEQLTFPPADSDDLGPSFSFDGERIVFQRRTHGRGALWILPAAGGDPKVLLADGSDNLTPAWRPDSRHVVFRSDRGGREALWEIDATTGSLRQITFETKRIFAYSISADERIAYAPDWHDTFLFSVDLETHEKRQLTSHTEDNFGPRFSPDASMVAYHSTRTGDSEIWVHHLDGSSETRVTDHPDWDLFPEWSPDGKRLVFVSNRDGPFKMFIANWDGGEVRLLVDQPINVRGQRPVNSEFRCRWSPDNELIAYLVAGKEGSDLWTVRPDGGGAQKVFDNVTAFDWYLDRRHGVVTRQRGSEYELVAVDLEKSQEQTLYVGPLMEIDVAPDGSAVAFCSGRGHWGMGLARLRLDPPSEPGGLPNPIGEPEYVVAAEGTWHVHNGGWSPDSKSLVYIRDKDYSNIYELVERE